MIEITEEDLVNDSTLTPLAGGSLVTLSLNTTLFEVEQLFSIYEERRKTKDKVLCIIACFDSLA